MFPQASAGATFQDSSMSGKFHGAIATTTPTGSNRLYAWWPESIGYVSPVASRAWSAKNRKLAAVLGTSAVRMSRIGLPMSELSASGELLGVLENEVGEPVQQRAALGPAHPRPRPLVERLAGRANRTVRLGRTTERHLGPRPLGPRVDGGEPRTVGRLHRLAVDDVRDQLHQRAPVAARSRS